MNPSPLIQTASQSFQEALEFHGLGIRLRELIGSPSQWQLGFQHLPTGSIESIGCPRIHLTLTHCQTPDRCSDNLLLSFGERWRNQFGSCALTVVLTPRDQGTGGQSWLASARPVLTKEIVERKQNNQIQLVLCLLPRDSASISTVTLFYTPSHHPVIHQSYPPRPWPLPSFKLGSSRDLRSWWNWTSSRMPCAWSMAALGIKKENPWLWDISPSLIYIYSIGMYA